MSVRRVMLQLLNVFCFILLNFFVGPRQFKFFGHQTADEKCMRKQVIINNKRIIFCRQNLGGT